MSLILRHILYFVIYWYTRIYSKPIKTFIRFRKTLHKLPIPDDHPLNIILVASRTMLAFGGYSACAMRSSLEWRWKMILFQCYMRAPSIIQPNHPWMTFRMYLEFPREHFSPEHFCLYFVCCFQREHFSACQLVNEIYGFDSKLNSWVPFIELSSHTLLVVATDPLGAVFNFLGLI